MWWYRLVTFVVGSIVYPYGWLRSAFGSVVWQGRLGLDKTLVPVDIWIHASSVGEVKVAETLINRLRRKKSKIKIHLSVMTKAGYQIASASIGAVVSLSFSPLDARFLVRRLTKRLAPKVMIITETEIWPTLISETAAQGAQLVLVNGRMSTRSAKQYARIGGLIRSVMQNYTRCFFKTAEDMGRFVSLGLPESNGEVAGDMKFDTTLLPADEVTIGQIRTRLGVTPDQFLIVAGSTRPGPDGTENEEMALLQVYKDLKVRFPQAKLILVPRHLDRVDEVMKAAESIGIKTVILDSKTTSLESFDENVIVVAYMGGLVELYQAADIAFVGGTLVPIGGHNLLEPVWSGTPVLFGPSLDNVTEASEYIITNNYGACISEKNELTQMIENMITDKRSFARREATDTAVSATGRVVEYLAGEGLL